MGGGFSGKFIGECSNEINECSNQKFQATSSDALLPPESRPGMENGSDKGKAVIEVSQASFKADNSKDVDLELPSEAIPVSLGQLVQSGSCVHGKANEGINELTKNIPLTSRNSASIVVGDIQHKPVESKASGVSSGLNSDVGSNGMEVDVGLLYNGPSL
ncbi:hypothetical protein QYF36_004542 [Acer negundo]|nr:hypothetical protein QYF36_004542 [Acer negundo]